MNGAGNQMNILILDACRNETRGTVLKQETSFKVPFQTFIAYSTTAGCTASDGLAGGMKKNGYPNVLNKTKHLEVSPKSSIFANKFEYIKT